MLSAWRGLYNYLARDHGYTHNPCAGLRAPKSTKSLPHVLSPDEAAKLLEFQANDLMTLRDKAMFELFYSSGLRLTELINLTPEDLNFTENTVLVHGKGNKDACCPNWQSGYSGIKRMDEATWSITQVRGKSTISLEEMVEASAPDQLVNA